jgi:hypothetical protein
MDNESSSSSEAYHELPDQAIANYREKQYGGRWLPCKGGVYYGGTAPRNTEAEDRNLIDG